MLYMTIIYNNFMVKTTIQLDESTRNLLRDKGKKSESYDDIILRMMAAAEGEKEKE